MFCRTRSSPAGYPPAWVGQAPRTDMDQAHRTQAWLAVADDAAARVSGSYFYHLQTREPNPGRFTTSRCRKVFLRPVRHCPRSRFHPEPSPPLDHDCRWSERNGRDTIARARRYSRPAARPINSDRNGDHGDLSACSPAPAGRHRIVAGGATARRALARIARPGRSRPRLRAGVCPRSAWTPVSPWRCS